MEKEKPERTREKESSLESLFGRDGTRRDGGMKNSPGEMIRMRKFLGEDY